jgi:hypothetical protein
MFVVLQWDETIFFFSQVGYGYDLQNSIRQAATA